jgi:hypothetical protein
MKETAPFIGPRLGSWLPILGSVVEGVRHPVVGKDHQFSYLASCASAQRTPFTESDEPKIFAIGLTRLNEDHWLCCRADGVHQLARDCCQEVGT